ncbi:MAG: GTPase Era [Oligoflexales bacterium]|nr:GTPase Era [Oligoflexales bacterium]
MNTRCGYIALLGRPNAGKSTLLNACIGQKIVGVSRRPQTTRNKVIGISSEGDTQLVFLDTPGIHKAQGRAKINHTMNKLAWSSAADADLICYMVDASKGWTGEDTLYFSALLEHAKVPVVVLASKADALKKAKINEGVDSILSGMKDCKEASTFDQLLMDEPLLISAKQKESVESFKLKLSSALPKSPWLYGEDELTDKPERFLVSELIREQLFRKLGAELPYGCGVTIESMQTGEKIVRIKACIIVARASHKPMVIGKGGRSIKEIGKESRLSLEQHFENKVYLELFVKVKENWIDRSDLICAFQQIEEA